jgi:hypothetical protein
MIRVTFAKNNYRQQKHSQKYLLEAIKMMQGQIVSNDSINIVANFPEKMKSQKLILDNAYFWANIR